MIVRVECRKSYKEPFDYQAAFLAELSHELIWQVIKCPSSFIFAASTPPPLPHHQSPIFARNPMYTNVYIKNHWYTNVFIGIHYNTLWYVAVRGKDG